MSDAPLAPIGHRLMRNGIGPDRAIEIVVLRFRRALENLEQSKGMLVEWLRCTPDEAFESLVAESQRTNRKLRDIASAHVRNGSRAHLRDEGSVG